MNEFVVRNGLIIHKLDSYTGSTTGTTSYLVVDESGKTYVKEYTPVIGSNTGDMLYWDGTQWTGTGRTGGTNNIIRFNLIGRRSDGYYTDSKISDISFYNKTLSQQEITQNYNATKHRYGL